QAVWGMARLFCTDVWRVALALAAAAALLLQSGVGAQMVVLVVAGLLGVMLPGTLAARSKLEAIYPVKPLSGLDLLLFVLMLLIGLPWAAQLWPNAALEVAGVFYRVGALVFGGGHVVLPLLQAEVVPRGWVSLDTFMAGYGAAQEVPGPLFTFAAFLGAALPGPLGGVTGALLALVAIFLPSFLLVAGALPLWEQLRQNQRAQAALAGINAAVVGLLLAALIQPVASSALTSLADSGVVLLALLALMRWKQPPWLVVLACGAAGWLLGLL
ncbi:chromate efflux transporter, partial [Rhodoferax sp. 4810]|nr:chromate efflux transporter [Rhodoferax jenense]